MSLIYLYLFRLPDVSPAAFSAHFHRVPYRELPGVKLCLSLATAQLLRP